MCANPVLTGLQGMVGRIMTIVEKLLSHYTELLARVEALEHHVFHHSGNIKSPQPPLLKGGQGGISNRRTSDVKPKNKSRAVLRLVKPGKEVQP